MVEQSGSVGDLTTSENHAVQQADGYLSAANVALHERLTAVSTRQANRRRELRWCADFGGAYRRTSTSGLHNARKAQVSVEVLSRGNITVTNRVAWRSLQVVQLEQLLGKRLVHRQS